ncbi:MBOAT family O-acyltransferase [Magnetospirillum molischianum]|uniref:Probable alginate O-acetylase AlgI n=1 Tax=Magnetospirillum molischianum DSM 120 TaxID=1150626 RepID=H8FSR4_MAGML|nr:MBOAT family O-acyltransferase [Magnetospirillum molischianum]CCG41402.1 Membrane-bound O-acyltransferase [Magnetospirillum molischianum DSM 120]
MVFNSVEFGFFFIFAWIIFVATPQQWRWGTLLGASAIFYAAWDWRYLGLIMGLAFIAFVYGRCQHFVTRKLTALAVFIILIPLIFIKYSNFIVDILLEIEIFFGERDPHFDPLSLILPLGISFYTFQLLSYCLDVRAGRCAPVGNYFKLLLYPLYFPHQIAGPIVRPHLLLSQFGSIHLPDSARMSFGLRIFLWGLFKKVFVADRLAVLVDSVYADPSMFHGAGSWLAFYFFAIQIYCDFSGYTDMAIGISHMFGINLCENFRRPYFATSIKDFWSRWHISLSTWFRDYVYIPLGGNRQGMVGWAGAILVVFAVSGLWHGANITFLLWGLFHGGLFLGEHTLRWLTSERIRRWFAEPAGKMILRLAVFHLVALGWVLFRSPSLADAGAILNGMASFGNFGALNQILPPTQMALAASGIAIVLLGDAMMEARGRFTISQMSLPLRWAAYCAVIFLVALFPGSNATKQFIYFQF